MIPNETKVESTLVGLESNEFSIQITDKSFKVLLDGLYTNKHQSIIRELWTNAYDSHVDAGIENIPFECKLPSSIDPSFYVRDFGTGLSHDDVMHLYSTVFASTKTNTNTQIGCLGLGSKSPFSYTDSFSVISFSGTEKRMYIAALNEDGIPSITHFSTEPCNEDRGLMVSFNSAEYDHGMFVEAAQRVILGFDVPPKIIGAELTVPEPVFAADTLTVYDNDLFESHMVQMGPVTYPIPSELTSNLSNLLNRNRYYGKFLAVIRVNVGDIDFAANREAIQMTPETRKTIENAINDNIAKVKATAETHLYESTSYLEACQRFSFWTNQFRGINLQSFDWNGDPNRPVGEYVWFDHQMNISYYGSNGLDDCGKYLKLPVGPKYSLPLFVIDSGEKVVRRNLRLKAFQKHHTAQFYILNNPSSYDLKRLESAFGLTSENFIKLSEIPDVETKKYEKDENSVRGVYRATDYSTLLSVTDIRSVPLDIPWVALPAAKKGTVISFNKLSYDAHFNDTYFDGIREIINASKFFGSPHILFVGPQAMKKLSDLLDPSFEFETFIINNVNSPEMENKIKETATISGPEPLHSDKSLVYEMLNIPLGNKPGTMPYLVQKYLDKHHSSEEMVFDTSELAEKYPLLFQIVDSQSISDYIEMCNNKEGN